LAGDIICKCWHKEYNIAVDMEKDLRKKLADLKRDIEVSIKSYAVLSSCAGILYVYSY
jgi:IS1 family transposase